MNERFSPGDRIHLSGDDERTGMVAGELRVIGGRAYYPVSFDVQSPPRLLPADALVGVPLASSVAQLIAAGAFAPADQFLASVTYKKLERPLADNLYTFYSSRTEFQVHQFKPVLKFLASPDQRLLIADEVGLGKTIESGIVLTELQARLGDLERVLIVCPSMLTSKWQAEMGIRFGLEFSIADRASLMHLLQNYDRRSSAPTFRLICSLQLLRSPDLLNRFVEQQVHLDVVIVDEAHHMRNATTRSNALGETLSDLADAMIMLSATPLHLGSEDLFNLLRILNPGRFAEMSAFADLIEPNQHITAATRLLNAPAEALEQLRRVETTSYASAYERNPNYSDLTALLGHQRSLTPDERVRALMLLDELNTLSDVFTRTRKKDVAVAFPVREARVLTVKFTPEEMDFYNSVTRYVESHFLADAGSAQGISFARIMPQRQVASCIPAMRDYLRDLLRTQSVQSGDGDTGDVIDFDEEDARDKLDRAELRAIANLLKAAELLRDQDTKFAVFLTALRELEREAPDAKILVFSFFKKTLQYLERRLAATEFRGRVSTIHGDVKPEMRTRIIRRFRDRSVDKILLSSEVGGEGLDFEFCSIIFNYDLPWNPMRVEQRIGRLDRYGQKSEKILIYNFAIEDTIDAEILNRLYGRISIFERYIGDLDAILGQEIANLAKEMFNPKLTRGQKQAYIEKVAENIVRREKELSRFDREAERFMGQDDYFTAQVSDIQRDRRFVTPQEVEHLVKVFLSTHGEGSTLRAPKSGREGVQVFKADEEFRRFVAAYCRGCEGYGRLIAALSRDEGVLVTFDSGEACRDDSLEFLTIHHPLLKAIKRWYDEHPDELSSAAALRLPGEIGTTGLFAFFLYILEKIALKQELELVPILIQLRDGTEEHWADEVSRSFLAHLAEATDLDFQLVSTGQGHLLDAMSRSEECMALICEEAETELRRRNSALLDARMEGMRQTAEAKIGRAQSTLERLRGDGHTDDSRIVRLYAGQIANLRARFEAETRALEARRTVAAGFSLALGGIVMIEPSGEQPGEPVAEA